MTRHVLHVILVAVESYVLQDSGTPIANLLQYLMVHAGRIRTAIASLFFTVLSISEP